MDRGAWQATVHGVAEFMDTTERLHSTSSCYMLYKEREYILREEARRIESSCLGKCWEAGLEVEQDVFIRFIQVVELPRWCSDKKKSTCQCRRCKRHRFDPWVGKIPRSRKWQPPPLGLLGKFHGQRSLAGYSPWGHKESYMTE